MPDLGQARAVACAIHETLMIYMAPSLDSLHIYGNYKKNIYIYVLTKLIQSLGAL